MIFSLDCDNVTIRFWWWFSQQMSRTSHFSVTLMVRTNDMVVRVLASHCCGPLFNFWAWCHMWDEFDVSSCPCPVGFLQFLWFSSLYKNQHSYIFQEPLDRRSHLAECPLLIYYNDYYSWTCIKQHHIKQLVFQSPEIFVPLLVIFISIRWLW